MSLKNDARAAAAEAGAKLAAKGFRKLMDHFARKRPNGLVSRFRRFFGIQTDAEIEQAHRDMLEAVQRAADEYRRKGSKP